MNTNGKPEIASQNVRGTEKDTSRQDDANSSGHRRISTKEVEQPENERGYGQSKPCPKSLFSDAEQQTPEDRLLQDGSRYSIR